jgi:hypothetical protein
MNPPQGATVLNLGGATPHLGSILLRKEHEDPTYVEQPEQDPRWRSLRVIALNLDAAAMKEYRQLYPHNSALIGDGCRMPFSDKSVDIVFSNAVIEHLAPPQQVLMAREIMRVGRSWFVTTPNFYYPFEIHHKLPCIQFLPRFLQLFIRRRFRTYPGNEPLTLLKASQLQRLFPGSAIVKQRVTFYPETLIAYHTK